MISDKMKSILSWLAKSRVRPGRHSRLIHLLRVRPTFAFLFVRAGSWYAPPSTLCSIKGQVSRTHTHTNVRQAHQEQMPTQAYQHHFGFHGTSTLYRSETNGGFRKSGKWSQRGHLTNAEQWCAESMECY